MGEWDVQRVQQVSQNAVGLHRLLRHQYHHVGVLHEKSHRKVHQRHCLRHEVLHHIVELLDEGAQSGNADGDGRRRPTFVQARVLALKPAVANHVCRCHDDATANTRDRGHKGRENSTNGVTRKQAMPATTSDTNVIDSYVVLTCHRRRRPV